MDDNFRYSHLLLVFLICVIAITGCSSSGRKDVDEPIAAPAPAPVPQDYDTDSDGVQDSIDQCANTPPDTKIDKNGCTVFIEYSVSYPVFPFPAPRPSISLVGLNIQDYYSAPSLGGLVRTLKNHLKDADYLEPSFYKLNGMPGFVMATQLERINKNGEPVDPSQRWIIDDMSLGWSDFSIFEYIKALVGARPGYYRTIVIFVKPKNVPLLYSETLKTESQVEDIYKKGTAQPEPDLIKVSTDDFDISFLIYEVMRSATGEEAAQVNLGISVQKHFEKSALKLWGNGDAVNE